MKQIQTLLAQTHDVYNWTTRLLKSIPVSEWDRLPDVLETTINWQVGHLIVSHYYHSVWVIRGMHPEVLRQLPLKEYGDAFTGGSPRTSVGQFNAGQLMTNLAFIQAKSIETLSFLAEGELEQELVPTGFPHPIAQTKREAIEWNIHHTMYHCGQIGILARILGRRYDFGLDANRN